MLSKRLHRGFRSYSTAYAVDLRVYLSSSHAAHLYLLFVIHTPLRHNNQPQHIRIRSDERQHVCAVEEERFPTLYELLRHYSLYPLGEVLLNDPVPVVCC